jgi:hypothetical protein
MLVHSTMTEQELTKAVHQLILESAPERRDELENLWNKYSPTFARASDEAGFKMEGGPWGLVLFTPRTTCQIWILGFAAWRAFEAYCPYVFLRIPITPSAMSDDPNQVKAEKALNDDLRKVRELKKIQNLEEFTWPSDMPEPGPALPATTRERAIVDLIKLATAFTFLHEVRHAMFIDDGNSPSKLDEEQECDRFARDFLLEKVSEYCASTHYDQEGVLNKRLMGITLGAFVILEITPGEKRGGTDEHPPVAARFRNLIQQGNYKAGEHVWIYVCSLMLGTLREEGKLPSVIPFRAPQDLFDQLVALL